MKKILTHQGEIAYDVMGEGVPLVLLRGLGRNVRHWLGYEKTLAKNYKVIVVDLRGVGRSTRKFKFHHTIWDLADDVAKVLDELNIGAAHILGISLGGMVTLAFGLNHPKRCLSIIVINASIGGLLTLRMRPKAMAFLVAKGLTKPHDIENDLIDYLIGSACPLEMREHYAKEHTEIQNTEPSVVMPVLKQIVAALRFRPVKEIMKMAMPTLIVYGTDDKFVSNINSQKLASLIPGSTLIAVEGAGHEVFLDKGDELLSIIQNWVQKRQSEPTWTKFEARS